MRMFEEKDLKEEKGKLLVGLRQEKRENGNFQCGRQWRGDSLYY